MPAQAQQPIPLASPGYNGLNTELSPMHNDHRFALRADNAVIDELGRLCSREAFQSTTTTNDFGFLSPDDVDFELMRMGVGYWNDEPHIIATVWAPTAKTAHLCKVDGAQLTEIAIPTLPNPEALNRARIVEIREKLYVFSKGNPVIVTDSVTATLLTADPLYTVPQDQTGNPIVTDINGDVACSAYGRLWVSGIDGQYDRIYYSDLLIPAQWYDARPIGTAGRDPQNTGGYIDVREYWPDGDDEIVGLTAHNGFLIVFGRRSILVYANPQGDPAGSPGISLADNVVGMGLISQESVVNIGSDLLFLDKTGVRSFGRTIQEKSIPIGDMSANVRRNIKKRIINETDRTSITMFYSRSRGIVGVVFPSERDAYIFSIKEPTETGALKTTYWNECDFNHAVHVEKKGQNETYLAGHRGTGALIYRGYDSAKPYDFHYESVACNLSPVSTQQRFPKSMVYALSCEKIDEQAIAWWGFDDRLDYSRNFQIIATSIAQYTNPSGPPDPVSSMFNVDRFGDKSGSLRDYRVNTKGKGTYFRVGLQVPIQGGGRVAIQEITVHTLTGRIH